MSVRPGPIHALNNRAASISMGVTAVWKRIFAQNRIFKCLRSKSLEKHFFLAYCTSSHSNGIQCTELNLIMLHEDYTTTILKHDVSVLQGFTKLICCGSNSNVIAKIFQNIFLHFNHKINDHLIIIGVPCQPYIQVSHYALRLKTAQLNIRFLLQQGGSSVLPQFLSKFLGKGVSRPHHLWEQVSGKSSKLQLWYILYNFGIFYTITMTAH